MHVCVVCMCVECTYGVHMLIVWVCACVYGVCMCVCVCVCMCIWGVLCVCVCMCVHVQVHMGVHVCVCVEGGRIYCQVMLFKQAFLLSLIVLETDSSHNPHPRPHPQPTHPPTHSFIFSFKAVDSHFVVSAISSSSCERKAPNQAC